MSEINVKLQLRDDIVYVCVLTSSSCMYARKSKGERLISNQ